MRRCSLPYNRVDVGIRRTLVPVLQEKRPVGVVDVGCNRLWFDDELVVGLPDKSHCVWIRVSMLRRLLKLSPNLRREVLKSSIGARKVSSGGEHASAPNPWQKPAAVTFTLVAGGWHARGCEQ